MRDTTDNSFMLHLIFYFDFDKEETL